MCKRRIETKVLRMLVVVRKMYMRVKSSHVFFVKFLNSVLVDCRVLNDVAIYKEECVNY